MLDSITSTHRLTVLDSQPRSSGFDPASKLPGSVLDSKSNPGLLRIDCTCVDCKWMKGSAERLNSIVYSTYQNHKKTK
jgi:hypothetical protein